MSASLPTRPLSHALGAEIMHVDLTSPVPTELFAQIRSIWVDNLVALVRGQNGLTPDSHLAFSRQFGTLDPNDSSPEYRLDGYPDVLEITNKPKPGGQPSPTREAGRKWHSDLEFTLEPTMASLLWCGQLPDVGGDTMFANMYMAYDELSAGLKRTLATMHVVFPVPPALLELGTPYNKVAQPVVRTHPESGRKSLFISQRASHFEGWSQEESKPLLQYLCAHATQAEFVYRHRWVPGDLLIWDNRCTLHQALGDYDRQQIRYMRRTSVKGSPSGYVASS